MKERTVREDAKYYFVPFLLGNNGLSRKLSAKIFRKYGIVSYIADQKRSLRDVFSLSRRGLALSSSDHGIICEELIALCSAEPYTLPLLIVTDEKYDRLLENNVGILEKHFVICSPDSLFSSSPLADIR